MISVREPKYRSGTQKTNESYALGREGEARMKKFAQSAALFLGTLLFITGHVSAQTAKFKADLAGKNEVPPVETTATGQATFQLSREATALRTSLRFPISLT